MFIFISNWRTVIFFSYSILKILNFHIYIFVLRSYIEFFFSSNFDVFFFLWIDCWKLPVVCQQISSFSYHFWDKLDRKGDKMCQFSKFNIFIFHPILMCFFLSKCSSYWGIYESIKKMSDQHFVFHFGKGTFI